MSGSRALYQGSFAPADFGTSAMSLQRPMSVWACRSNFGAPIFCRSGDMGRAVDSGTQNLFDGVWWARPALGTNKVGSPSEAPVVFKFG